MPLDDISSNRLLYRRLTLDDWPFFLALNQDRSVMKYISDPRSEDEIREHAFDCRIAEWQKGCDHWLCLLMHEKTSGLPVGATGFIDRGEGIAEVGFVLSAAFHGKGYGIESLQALIEFSFKQHDFRKLVATVTAGNEASKRTLIKAGFLQEGTLRRNYYLDGKWQDDWIFGLLREEFLAEHEK